MDLALVLIAIALAFAGSLLFSYALTQASGVGRVRRVDLDAVVACTLQPGIIFETTARAELVEFEALRSPPALMLADGNTRIPAVAPEAILRELGTDGACLLPTDPSKLAGTVRSLGTFRILGSMDDLPVPHVKIRSIAKP